MPTLTELRDRIIDFKRVPASEIFPSDFNWRTHPDHQADAVEESLTRWGIYAPLLTYRDADGTQKLFDGHLRDKRITERLGPQQLVPIIVTDLSEDEARSVILTHDPLAALAGADKAKLDALMRECIAAGEESAKLLANLAKANDIDWDAIAAANQGLAAMNIGPQSSGGGKITHGSLVDRFLVPPFSVLDARQGYWQDRKRQWLALGMQSELGRGAAPGGGPDTPDGPEALDRLQERPNATPGGSPLKSGKPRSSPGKIVRGDLHSGVNKPAAAKDFGSGGSGEMSAAFKSQGRQTALSKTGDSRAIPGGGVELIAAIGSSTAAGYGTGPESQQEGTGTSIFDPVLCEIAYRWFAPEGGTVLDPFAGGSVRGIVAAALGRKYTGADLREEQVAANVAQLPILNGLAKEEDSPAWITGDARNVIPAIEQEFDLLFSCPPYHDLEQYSYLHDDLSNMPWDEFMPAYREIISAACSKLKQDRFAVWVIGEVRGDGEGKCRGLVPETIRAFEAAGLDLYNDAVLVTAVGSLPLRTAKQFTCSRKFGRTHQYVLVFVKGSPRKAAEACGQVAIDDAVFEAFDKQQAEQQSTDPEPALTQPAQSS